MIVGGWSSAGYERSINADLSTFSDRRPNVLLYVRDLDPAGESIELNIAKRVGFDDVQRVAFTAQQATDLNLPENSDPAVAAKLQNHPGRAAFVARPGRLFQVGADAVPPDPLRAMLDSAIAPFWDRSTFDDSLDREAEERATL